jgi:hypothetical protein
MDITLTKPHPRSYGAALPLSGFTDAQLLRVTADDKATYAARPITLTDLAPARVERLRVEFRADAASPKHCEKARALFVTLNVNDETSASGQTATPCAEGHRHDWQRVSQQAFTKGDLTRGWEDDHGEFLCTHCDTLVRVGPERIAATPKIPCPYAARNRREAKAELTGEMSNV